MKYLIYETEALPGLEQVVLFSPLIEHVTMLRLIPGNATALSAGKIQCTEQGHHLFVVHGSVSLKMEWNHAQQERDQRTINREFKRSTL